MSRDIGSAATGRMQEKSPRIGNNVESKRQSGTWSKENVRGTLCFLGGSYVLI
jgi:hypothetical protein